MGRSGMRRRKPPRHLPKVGGHADPRGIGPQHSPWTIEGGIEAYGTVGRGLTHGSPAQNRYLGRLVVITVAVLGVVGIAAWLVSR